MCLPAFAGVKEGMKAGKGHTVCLGDGAVLSRAKRGYDRRVLPRIIGSGALLGSFVPFVSLESPRIADVDPKVYCDSRRVLYFSQTRYCMAHHKFSYFWPSTFSYL